MPTRQASATSVLVQAFQARPPNGAASHLFYYELGAALGRLIDDGAETLRRS